MTVDIVIPNYNGFDLIKKNLPHVISAVQKYKDAEIIIVDDFSKAEEFERLEKFVRELKDERVNIFLVRNEKNLGFSSTVNRGIKESKADLVVILNTDVVPENNFLDAAVVDFDSNSNLFGVGLMDKSIESGKTVLRGRGLAFWKRGFLVHRRGEVDEADTFWISGGSSVIRREIFNKLGGFDTLYNPFYWEDIDLSYRAKKVGWDICFESKGIVEHRHEEGAIKKHYNSSRIKTIAYRNQFIFVWKNITDIGLLLSHILFLPYHSARALTHSDWPFFAGFFSAIVLLPKIIAKRSEAKRLFTRSDRDIIKSNDFRKFQRRPAGAA